MITPEGLNEISQAIVNLIGEGRFYLGSQEIKRPPFRTNIDGNKIRVLLYLDDSDIGKFENFVILSKNGKVLFEKPDSIVKQEQEGLIVAFGLELREIIEGKTS